MDPGVDTVVPTPPTPMIYTYIRKSNYMLFFSFFFTERSCEGSDDEERMIKGFLYIEII